MDFPNGKIEPQLLSPSDSPPVLSPVVETEQPVLNGHVDGTLIHDGRESENPAVNGFAKSSNGASKVMMHDRTRNRSRSDVGPLHIDESPQRRDIGLVPLDLKKANHTDVLKMSPSQIFNLTTAPESLPVRPITPESDDFMLDGGSRRAHASGKPPREWNDRLTPHSAVERTSAKTPPIALGSSNYVARNHGLSSPPTSTVRPAKLSRSMSIPVEARSKRHITDMDSDARPTPSPNASASARRRITTSKGSHRDRKASARGEHLSDTITSSLPASVPLPPFSLPTYLQLELATQRPSPLYIYRPSSADIPYEPTSIKFERLLNFLLIPPYLEKILLFGALTCLDYWLYTFTVLPLRFFKSLWVLLQWTGRHLVQEARDLVSFTFNGLPRVWKRRRRKESIKPLSESSDEAAKPRRIDSLLDGVARAHQPLPARLINKVRSRRSNISTPSSLQQNQKADILSGLLVILGCIILSRFDASRMYHNIRGQAAIKLYVIYNVLEVCDRLFSAVGQDIMECLFSQDTLERKADGRSKVFQPIWLFILALVYTVIHATALFYQVITLNVAVNSYSNALLTLLMSNQFVEIKGTVFKKFEKENLFQLTCADVVERFQLWLMLLIIALRNIVEVGGLSINNGGNIFSAPSSSSNGNVPPLPNVTNPVSSTFGILPNAFTTLPNLFPFQVLTPFLLVLGSEMLVDWLKHAYITKFNATSPQIYSRFLDILSKDYYTHAFVDQNLTKRLGLPVIPLACLFIRATLQTYHMFLATNISAPSISTATSLTSAHSEAEPTTSPVLVQIDQIFRRALGHSSFGGGGKSAGIWSWTIDDCIALATMLLFFLALYLLLLALKLALGMVLLGVARSRYSKSMERDLRGERERLVETESKRLGGWGVAELGEERREKIYEGHEGELRKLKEKERQGREREERERGGRGLKGLEGVERYAMVAKRIW